MSFPSEMMEQKGKEVLVPMSLRGTAPENGIPEVIEVIETNV